jgi:hypothetical protein
VLRPLTCVLVLLVCVLAGCGGGGGAAKQKDRPTATPPPVEPTPQGLDVQKIAKARNDFATACKKREAAHGGSMADVRAATDTLLAALHANPDDKFRYSSKLPPASMRQRMRALALVARTNCGGGDAVKLGRKIGRAATRKNP